VLRVIAIRKEASVSVQANRYAPPRSYVSDANVRVANAEAVRREHIKHEASVRSIGVLYWLSGALLLTAGVVGALSAMNGAPGTASPLGPVPFVVLGGFGIASIAVGNGMRALRPWARTTSIVMSVIGLLGIPVGTLINGYILYLLFAEKGKRLFEPDYQGIIAATPHVKHKTSIVVWIFVGLLVLLIAAVVIAGILR
jgi:hypothetical protein